MGHMSGKDVFQKAGEKIDSLTVRVPLNESFRKILKEVFTEEEADIYARMPYVFSNLDRIVRTTGMEKAKLQKILDGLASKGLVIDFWIEDEYKSVPLYETFPFVGWSIAAIVISSVVLPLPLGPRITRYWPLGISRLTESRAFTDPDLVWYVFVTFSRVIIFTIAPTKFVQDLRQQRSLRV